VVGASGSPEVRTVGTDGFHYFTDDWYMWDTFRTSHPLRTLVEPELVDDIITSMLVHFEEGGWLPKCSWNATGYSRVTIGNHAVPIIVDGFLKGLDRIDVDLAWEAIDRAGSDEIPDLPDGGCGYVNLGTPQEYIDLGYVPSECDPTQSVSMTLEHAYDDWATARFAEAIGRSDDAARYDNRGTWWLNHWNPDEEFMQARDRAGDWITPFDPADDSDFNDSAPPSRLLPWRPGGDRDGGGSEHAVLRAIGHLERRATHGGAHRPRCVDGGWSPGVRARRSAIDLGK